MVHTHNDAAKQPAPVAHGSEHGHDHAHDHAHDEHRQPAKTSDLDDEPDTIPSDLQQHLDQQEREILVKALEDAGFNRTAAASRLGLSLRQMRYRIARLNIDMPQGSDAAEDPKQSG